LGFHGFAQYSPEFEVSSATLIVTFCTQIITLSAAFCTALIAFSEKLSTRIPVYTIMFSVALLGSSIVAGVFALYHIVDVVAKNSGATVSSIVDNRPARISLIIQFLLFLVAIAIAVFTVLVSLWHKKNSLSTAEPNQNPKDTPGTG